MNLEVEPVTEESQYLKQINKLAQEAFPPEEYLAPSSLIEMAKQDCFDFWVLKDQNQFVGFMVVQCYKNMAYLFFLAIDPTCRSKGYGQKAIKTLKKLYPNYSQVVDFEKVDEIATNRLQREKRRRFYLKNGYKETGLFLSYLGVDYEVFCMDEHFDGETFKALMQTIQVEGFNPKYFN